MIAVLIGIVHASDWSKEIRVCYTVTVEVCCHISCRRILCQADIPDLEQLSAMRALHYSKQKLRKQLGDLSLD